MPKKIQDLKAWGYVVEKNATGFETVRFSTKDKHTNLFHPKTGRQAAATVPITTFSVTGADPTLLKIPRTFNNDPAYDPRPKAHKLNLRDQIVAFWATVERRPLPALQRIEYTSVVEPHLADLIYAVYEACDKDEAEDLTLRRDDPLFRMLLARTPFLAGVQKMLNEYADKFAGKKIESCHFSPLGCLSVFDFTITLS